MKSKYLFQALKFVCLPTLSVLLLLFFAFFSITDALAFISASSAGAVTLRILLFIVEIVLVVIMYFKYQKEDILKNPEDQIKNNSRIRAKYTNLSELNSEWVKSGYTIYVHDTGDSDLFVVQGIYKSND